MTISKGTVNEIIRSEVRGPSSLGGYCSMWNKVRLDYNLTVHHDTFMRVTEVDPAASALRKARKLRRRVYVLPGPHAI